MFLSSFYSKVSPGQIARSMTRSRAQNLGGFPDFSVTPIWPFKEEKRYLPESF